MTEASTPRTGRAVSIDALRAVVMLIMVVDHAREYSAGPGLVTDPMAVGTPPLLFWMRWAAHFCAPTFVLLAGVSARLQRETLTPAPLSRHLVVRGLVLILLEFTVIDWGWTFNPFWPRKFAQVIWGIGLSMIALAALSRLPRTVLAVVAVAIVAGHNLLDDVVGPTAGVGRYLWAVLHHRELLPLPFGYEVRTSYPVLPMIGLAACGYLLGDWWTVVRDGQARARRLAGLGLGLLAAFVVLRGVVGYGDPHPWVAGTGVMGFLNLTKYPMSLSFMLMTLGPALLLLAAWERAGIGWAARLIVFGRVPMAFYIAHLWALHALALLWAVGQGFPLSSFDLTARYGAVPAGFGFPLWVTFPFAAVTSLALLPFCRWYDRLRQSKRVAWTRYV